MKKIFLYIFVISMISSIGVYCTYADILENIINWTTISCDKAGDMVREGIGKFYHDETQGTKLIERASSSCVSNDEYAYDLAVAYFKSGRLEDALSKFKDVSRGNSSFREAKRALAYLYVNSEEELAEGGKIAEKLSMDREDSYLSFLVSDVYKQKGDPRWKDWLIKGRKEAAVEQRINIKEYTDAITKANADPNLGDRKNILYVELGLLYEKMREFDLAVDFFKKGNSGLGWWHLGRFYARAGDTDKAEEYLKKGIDFSAGLEASDIAAIKSDIKHINDPIYFKKGEISFIYPEKFTKIPAGEFTMGKTGGAWIEAPEHKVYTDPFLIGQYEVSNAEYMIYVESTGAIPPYNCCKSKYDLWNKLRVPQKIVEKPVVNVSWQDAIRYIGWKNNRFGKRYRLPTEAEWEKAAKGEDKRIYPWGEADPTLDISYYGKHWDGINTMADVASLEKGKSPYGIFHASGNVWEWCFDWFRDDYYTSAGINKNPRGPNKGEFKVLRGGSWMNSAQHITTTFRNRNWPDVRYSGIGFRLSGEI